MNIHLIWHDSNIFRQPPPPPSPQPSCQYCSHCNSCITTTKTTTLAGSPLPQHHHHPSPQGTDTKITTRTTHYTTATGYPDNKGPPYPNDHSPTYAIPVDNTPRSNYPPNQGGPPVRIFNKNFALLRKFFDWCIFLFKREALYISIQPLIILHTILPMDGENLVLSQLEIYLRRRLRVLSHVLKAQHLEHKSHPKDWMNWWLIFQDMRFVLTYFSILYHIL